MTQSSDARPRPVSRAAAAHVSRYADLARQVGDTGLLRRAHAYYWTCFALAVTAGLAGGAAVVLLRDSWWVLAPAAGLGVVSAHLGFLGHDAAHRQIFASRAWNEWAARVISGGLTGLSYGWWVRKHDRHHARPNQVDRDPDIASGVVAITAEAVSGRTGLAARAARLQGWWFVLVLPFEGVHLHVQSVATVLGRAPLRRRGAEAALLAVRLVGGTAALFAVLSPGRALAVLAVQEGVFGLLLGGAFAPNHLGMPIVPAEARLDFLDRQVLVSRDVTGGPVVRFLMGGLDHQIEHHLFPDMARPCLRRARPLVRAYCAAQGVSYTETTLPQALAAVVRHLDTVGRGGADPFRCPVVALARD